MEENTKDKDVEFSTICEAEAEPPWEGPRVVPAQMRRVNNLLFRKTNQYMRANGADEVTPMHGWILGYLYMRRGDDIFQRDIEKEFSITRSTVTNILQLMERKGYIVRRSVSHDARLKRLELTDTGVRLHESTMDAFHQTEKFVAELLTSEEQNELLRILEKLREGLQ